MREQCGYCSCRVIFHFYFPTPQPIFPFLIPSISHKTWSQVWTVSVWWMSFTGYITGKQWKLNPTPYVCEMMRANLHYPASPWNLCQLASRWGTSQSQSCEPVSDLLITIITFTKKKKKRKTLAIYCSSSVTLGLEFCISQCLFSLMFLQLYLRLVAYSLCISVSLCNITWFSQCFMPEFNLAQFCVCFFLSIWVCCISKYFSMFFSFIKFTF